MIFSCKKNLKGLEFFFFIMRANGLQLPIVGGLELQICPKSKNLKRTANYPNQINPPIVGRCGYGQVFFQIIS